MSKLSPSPRPASALFSAALAALVAVLALSSLAQAQILSGPPGDDQLTPQNVAAQPRLSQRDVRLFVDLFNTILSVGAEQSDIASFARIHGVGMLRLNYVAVKLAFPFVPETAKNSILNELGLGILMNAEEKALMEENMSDIEPIMRFFQEGL
ncbi:MAG: hypothetical protein LBE49_03865 [Deltaproteobacteria bacterium]|jgi:hypothetical protein|nr:hypothetical protein [Deltaproteobacteria bacterium]